ncbi:hypothetical protein A33O_15206 [Nitratireductor aquibiodomus RA22]|uniref:Uncharacterized protein n=1 Tax=Nitratireductor aquibiodomus RA22 TaxID=1189611 RepID=I5BVD4_9HYPH|nr:hypothetical protein A33O_15206 [Nitratireductor aquibiodomus RA22]
MQGSDLFDFSHWPVVVAQMPAYNRFRMDEWTGGLDAILARETPFVLVVDLQNHLEEERETQEEKKKGAAWMKRKRDAYSRLCRGNVYVVADPERRSRVLTETRQQGRAFGIPFEAEADLAGAIDRARTLL